MGLDLEVYLFIEERYSKVLEHIEELAARTQKDLRCPAGGNLAQLIEPHEERFLGQMFQRASVLSWQRKQFIGTLDLEAGHDSQHLSLRAFGKNERFR